MTFPFDLAVGDVVTALSAIATNPTTGRALTRNVTLDVTDVTIADDVATITGFELLASGERTRGHTRRTVRASTDGITAPVRLGDTVSRHHRTGQVGALHRRSSGRLDADLLSGTDRIWTVPAIDLTVTARASAAPDQQPCGRHHTPMDCQACAVATDPVTADCKVTECKLPAVAAVSWTDPRGTPHEVTLCAEHNTSATITVTSTALPEGAHSVYNKSPKATCAGCGHDLALTDAGWRSGRTDTGACPTPDPATTPDGAHVPATTRGQVAIAQARTACGSSQHHSLGNC